MKESSGGKRSALLRASLLFQLKLLADGFRDFLLLPVSLVATLVGLVRSAEDPEREFEQVLDLGRRSERWINLFGTHDPAGGADTLDQLVDRAERRVQEEVRRGDLTESAGTALTGILDSLHRRGREKAPGTARGQRDRKATEDR